MVGASIISGSNLLNSFHNDPLSRIDPLFDNLEAPQLRPELDLTELSLVVRSHGIDDILSLEFCHRPCGDNCRALHFRENRPHSRELSRPQDLVRIREGCLEKESPGRRIDLSLQSRRVFPSVERLTHLRAPIRIPLSSPRPSASLVGLIRVERYPDTPARKWRTERGWNRPARWCSG